MSYAQSSYISRDYYQPGDKYINYSGRNYENYSTQFIRRRFYDNFGNFLVDGVQIYGLGEQQQQFTGESPGGTSSIVKSRYYNQYFNNLVILNDTYGGFNTRLMVGDAIRTKFTSLTFDKARFNGIRWDAATAKYRGSLVLSRISDPIRVRFDQYPSVDGWRRTRNWTQYLFGGHFETDIGDIATVGVTYLNQHQRRADISSSEVSIKGVVANAIPRVIFVRVSDDSPGDLSGPIIYGVPTVIINGLRRSTVNINGGLPNPRASGLNNPVQYYVFRNFDISRLLYTGIDTTSWTRYTNYRDRFGVARVDLPVYPAQIPSGDNLTYAFVIPVGSESVTFSIILANDFKVEAAHDYVNIRDEYGTDARFVSHTDSVIFAAPTIWKTFARAPGNVKDGSNKQIVTFNYGLTTGMAVYGLNFRLNLLGFDIEGEMNQSLEYSKYPLLKGPFFENKGSAYFIRGTKKVGRFMFGGERYRIEPDYITALNIFTLENSYFSTPGTPPALISVPPDKLDTDPSQGPIFAPGGAYYMLVDVNTDKDRWEDGFYFYDAQPTDPRNSDILNRFPDPYHLGYRLNSNELQSLTDIVRKPDAGIFPGRMDETGVPLDDRNLNGIPDYLEDFLTFYSDPPSFLYGDDWNNNGVIDAQEINIVPGYPYDPDIDGYHLFSKFELLKSMNLTLGLLRESGLARGGHNKINYLKFTYDYATPRFGGVNLYYTAKRVEDDIPNSVYQYLGGVITAQNPIPTFITDSLYYKDSFVHTLFVGTRYTQIPDLNIENDVKVEVNNQYHTGYQPPGRITFWGIVNKIDYTINFFDRRLQLKPQLKFRTEKRVKTIDLQQGGISRQVSVLYHNQEIIPIFRIDYRLTDRTDVHFGLQGFSLFGLSDLFTYRIRNLKDNYLDENRQTAALSITNRSDYGGYKVLIELGVKFTKHDYLREEDKKRGSEESLIFFSIYAGF